MLDSPAGIADKAKAGEVDAAIISVAEVAPLGDDWIPLGPYGIATRSLAQSVLLFSTTDWKHLRFKTIYVTPESRTSLHLLRILLCWKHHVYDYTITDKESIADAWLWIGDRALGEMNSKPSPYIFDLGKEWTEWQHMPFVFARWMVKRQIPENVRAEIGYHLGRALEHNLLQLPDLVMRFPNRVLPPKQAVTYLRGFIYRFGPTEDAGLQRFLEYLTQGPQETPHLPLYARRIG